MATGPDRRYAAAVVAASPGTALPFLAVYVEFVDVLGAVVGEAEVGPGEEVRHGMMPGTVLRHLKRSGLLRISSIIWHATTYVIVVLLPPGMYGWLVL